MTAAPPRLTPEESSRLRDFPQKVELLREQVRRRILGQESTVRELMISFFASGHCLVVGVPGLAKTLMISTLSEIFDLSFARIQFTPDLMPSDITGTTLIVRNETTGSREFQFRQGPVFTNLLLADEINRTPPKTQAALLEAMEEYQVTVGGEAHRMPRPFFVLATQNPIEQEGTYPLPVTQLDRFLFQINMDYPDLETEFDVVASTTATSGGPLEPVLDDEDVAHLLAVAPKVHIPARIMERAVTLVRATRAAPESTGSDHDLPPSNSPVSSTATELLAWGAGPRGVQAILYAARAAAVLEGRPEVTDADYEEVINPALRHRILLNYHAEAEKIRPDDVIDRIRVDIGDLAEARQPAATAKGRRSHRLSRLLRVIGDPSPKMKRRRR